MFTAARIRPQHFALVKTVVENCVRNDMITYAAALAYFLFFSIFPFTLFLVAVLGFFDLSDLLTWIRREAQDVLTPEATRQLEELFRQLQQRRQALLSFGMLITLWAASSSMRAAMRAMNAIFGTREGRPVWKRYPLSVLYTVLIGAMLTASIVLMLVGPGSVEWATREFGTAPQFLASHAIWWIRWPIVAALLATVIATIYRLAPDTTEPFRLLTPGAILAVIVWIIASVGFHHYVGEIVDYNAMFGSVGVFIALLLYLYISSLVLLLGAEINAALARHKRPDNTACSQAVQV